MFFHGGKWQSLRNRNISYLFHVNFDILKRQVKEIYISTGMVKKVMLLRKSLIPRSKCNLKMMSLKCATPGNFIRITVKMWEGKTRS